MSIAEHDALGHDEYVYIYPLSELHGWCLCLLCDFQTEVDIIGEAENG